MPTGDEHADLQASDRPTEKSATPSEIAAGNMMRLNATSMASLNPDGVGVNEPLAETGAKAAVAPGKASDKAVRQVLMRILGSKTFSQVDRLRRFVDFIVTETVDGRGGDLKEYGLGVQVFGKEAGFDPRTGAMRRSPDESG